MFTDYDEFMKNIHYIKDKMKEMGIESIDLNYAGSHITEVVINDAETYTLIRKEISPNIQNEIINFSVEGWAKIRFVAIGQDVEEEYQKAAQQRRP